MSSQALRGILPAVLLCLAGCFQEDNTPDYSIHVGDVLEYVQGDIGPDGEPVLIVEMRMIYRFDGEPPQGYLPTRSLNYPFVVYSRKQGAWSEFPFRNLNRSNQAWAAFLRDGKGGLHPTLQDELKIKVYGRHGDDWVPSTQVTWPYTVYRSSAGFPSLGLTGEDTLHGMSFDQDSRQIQIVSSSGRRQDLPTEAGFFQPYVFYSAPGFNAMAGSSVINADRVGYQLAYASWKGDLQSPPLYQTFGESTLPPAGIYFKNSGGEITMSAIQGDSLLVFKIDAEGKPALPRLQLLDRLKDSTYSLMATTLGEDGCLHEIAARFGVLPYPTDYIHKSSCLDGVDSLQFPKPEGINVRVHGINLMAGKDGISAVLNLGEDTGTYSSYDTYEHSWLYLAELRGGHWNFEQVAAF